MKKISLYCLLVIIIIFLPSCGSNIKIKEPKIKGDIIGTIDSEKLINQWETYYEGLSSETIILDTYNSTYEIESNSTEEIYYDNGNYDIIDTKISGYIYDCTYIFERKMKLNIEINFVGYNFNKDKINKSAITYKAQLVCINGECYIKLLTKSLDVDGWTKSTTYLQSVIDSRLHICEQETFIDCLTKNIITTFLNESENENYIFYKTSNGMAYETENLEDKNTTKTKLLYTFSKEKTRVEKYQLYHYVDKINDDDFMTYRYIFSQSFKKVKNHNIKVPKNSNKYTTGSYNSTIRTALNRFFIIME